METGDFTSDWESSPGDQAPEFYTCLSQVLRDAPPGPVLLAEADERALRITSISCPAAHVYACQTKGARLQSFVRRGGFDERFLNTLLFHGSSRHLNRDIPIRPGVLAVTNVADAAAWYDDLPYHSYVVSASPLRAWESSGFVSVISIMGSARVYRVMRNNASPSEGLAAPLFRSVRSQLLGRYFAGNGDLTGSYTLVANQTASARRWWMEAMQHGTPEWPYLKATENTLPSTLPDGSPWPLISIVTPSFNQGKFIEETILSVARQNYPRVQHIVMDGGSTDQTCEILDRYKGVLACAVSEKDRGQSHAINKGMALADGELLTWLNSDDMLAPGALAAVALAFFSSKADIVAGIACLRQNGRTVARHLTACEPGPLPLDDILDLEGGWNAGQFFYQPEVLFTREIWEKTGGFVREDLFYSMDYDLWVRMAEKAARLHVIGRPVAWFRMHDEQKTSVDAKFKAELSGYVDAYNASHGRNPPVSKVRQNPRHRLRITMLNDHGYRFGAGVAHKRTAESLALAGHEVSALQLRTDPGYEGEQSRLTAAEVEAAVDLTRPDLIVMGNVHSAGPEAAQIDVLARRYPVLAALHDFWILTGRCAYPLDCGMYRTGCNETCPTAGEYPKLDPDKIAGAWKGKQRLLSGSNHLALIGNSDWTCRYAEDALASTGRSAPVERFRLSFPLDIFRGCDKKSSRRYFNLPEDGFIVILAGDLYDPRKNVQFALDSLGLLDLPDLTVVSLGNKREGEVFSLPDVRRLGQISDPSTMAFLYSAADLLIGASKEETFGQVFIEAIACGTPVIGLRASGMQEAVTEGITGLLIDQTDADALAAAVLELYRKPQLRRDLGVWGRIYVENEWSPEAAYYHMFRAWRNLGLLERLGVPPKIGFLPDPPVLSDPVPIMQPTGLTPQSMDLGPEEGPYDHLRLPRFRWAYGPVSRVSIHAAGGGQHSLVLRYRNLHPKQRLGLVLNGQTLGEYPLMETGIESDRLLCVAVPLRSGSNQLLLRFDKWSDPGLVGRPLAVAITELAWLPDEL